MELPELVEGRLVRRYQRFFADVEIDGAGVVTAHCPNTGSMIGCATPGSRVWLSQATNPARKLAWTWELVEARPGVVVGVHTGRINRLAGEAIEAGLIGELARYPRLRGEVRYGANSRIDWLLEADDAPACYVEVKSVTAAAEGMGFFPDAVTARGTRHLREMIKVVETGCRAALVFCVPRGDVTAVRPAVEIDPAYGEALKDAAAGGVEIYAVGACASPSGIVADRILPVLIP